MRRPAVSPPDRCRPETGGSIKGGDHAPLDGEGIEQLPQGRDFVVLGLDRALGQDGALPREQGGEQMRLAAIVPTSALEGLAIDGQGFVGRGASPDFSPPL